LIHRRELGRQVQEAVDRRDWDEARSTLEHLIRAAPHSAEAYMQRARVLRAQGYFDAAEQSYRQALEIDPAYPAALVGLSELETQRGELQQSIERLEKAIELDPKRAEAHLARAKTLEAFGRIDDSLAAYYRVLEFDPGCVDAMVRAAAIQLGKGRPEQALARLDHALELSPDFPDALHHRGRARLATNDPEGAVVDLRKAATKLPSDSEVYYDLAVALERLNRPVDALDAAQHALQISPRHAAAGELIERLRR
jgi:tetratricopeptide (TPR) repeat protein